MLTAGQILAVRRAVVLYVCAWALSKIVKEARPVKIFLSILNYNCKLRNEQRLVSKCTISDANAAKSTVPGSKCAVLSAAACTVPANIDELDDACAANDDATRYTRKGPGNEGSRITQGSFQNPHPRPSHLPQVPKVWTNCVHQTRFEASVVLVPRHQHCFGPNVFLLDSILRKRHERNPAPLQRLQCTNRQGSRLQHRHQHMSLTIILTKFIK